MIVHNIKDKNDPTRKSSRITFIISNLFRYLELDELKNLPEF